MTTFAEKKAAGQAFVAAIHAGQTRADGSVPAWYHLARVSFVLERVLAETGEGTAEEREAIALAALGHDSLEDTDVEPKELEKRFGARGLQLIEGMTNRLGDDDHGPYVRQVAAAEEAVRLIKLADLYDNLTGVTYDLFVLGSKWTDEWFRPIVEPMIETVLPTAFTTYPRTAERLCGMVRIAHALLKEESARYKAAGR